MADINSRKDEYVRSLSEVKTNPLPPNIMAGCIYWETDENDATDWMESLNEDDIGDWESLDDKVIIEKFGEPGANYARTEANKDLAEYWPCAVYTKDESNGTAVVRIFQNPTAETTKWISMEIPRLLTDYPMESIKFFHGPYKSDQHLPNAFRHHVGLPDDLIPDHWKEEENDGSSACATSN